MAKLMVCLTLTLPIPSALDTSPIGHPVKITHVGVWPPPPFPPPSPPPTYYQFPFAPAPGPAHNNNHYVKPRVGGANPNLTPEERLARLRQCENKGVYDTSSRSGKYRGAYQFAQGTWDGVAPEGWAGVDPATAPPEVQDQAAQTMIDNGRLGEFPICGRGL